VNLVQLDGSPHDWMEGRGPQLTALGMQDGASGKILATQFFSSETSQGYFRLLQSLLPRHGVPVAFYGDRSAIFTRNDDHWSVRLVVSRPRVIESSETRPLRP